jgi:hypothetical protein
MKERVLVTIPTRPTSRDAGPTYPPSIDDPDIVAIIDSAENSIDSVVDTQVERILDPNGNETVITTVTTFLPNGTKRVVKTIETIEDSI